MDDSPLVAHIPGLRRYARALTGDAWAADDLVQDTLERACTKWRLWRAGSNLRAWLFTVMHNVYVNQVRRAMQQSAAGVAIPVEDIAHELTTPDTNGTDTLDLQRCLLRLPEDQRVVLLLVTLEDLSYDDVARITGVPVGTVMSRLSRARSRLRTLMGGDPPVPLSVPAPTLSSPAPLRRMK